MGACWPVTLAIQAGYSSMVVQDCNPTTWKAEAGGSLVWSQLGIYSEILNKQKTAVSLDRFYFEKLSNVFCHMFILSVILCYTWCIFVIFNHVRFSFLFIETLCVGYSSRFLLTILKHLRWWFFMKSVHDVSRPNTSGNAWRWLWFFKRLSIFQKSKFSFYLFSWA